MKKPGQQLSMFDPVVERAQRLKESVEKIHKKHNINPKPQPDWLLKAKQKNG